MYKKCGIGPHLAPITAAFSWRSKAHTLLKVDVAVDGNRDGEIEFANATDRTTMLKMIPEPYDLRESDTRNVFQCVRRDILKQFQNAKHICEPKSTTRTAQK